MFSYIYISDSIIAIIAGLIGTYLSQYVDQIAIKIFDLSLIVVLVSIILLTFLWSENYGINHNDNSKKTQVISFKKAYHILIANTAMIKIGLISCLFESSMYIFIMIWHPLLSYILITLIVV